MKLNIVNKWKLWVIITLIIVILGMALIAGLGFNKTVESKDSYEVDVHFDQDIGDVKTIVKETADKFFKENEKSAKVSGIQEYELGYIYKFSEADFDIEALNTALTTAVSNIKVSVDAELREVVPYVSNQTWKIVLAIAIATIVGFVILLFIEKAKASFTVTIMSVLSILINLSVVGIARIPVLYVGVFVALTFALTFVLSIGLLNRVNETIKLNEKMEKSEVANKCASQSIFRFAFVFGALLITSLLFIILGSSSVAYIGLELLVSAISATFTSLVLVPTLWANLK